MEEYNNKSMEENIKNMMVDDVTDDSSDDTDDDIVPEVVLPLRFFDPLTPEERALMNKQLSASTQSSSRVTNNVTGTVEGSKLFRVNKSKQFWNAGEYEAEGDHVETETCNMDRLRVSPQFLHSNATSHKWALGAFAELLDNALDEVCNGATYVHVDVIKSKKDKSKMLLVEDNGGGMSPDMLRQCMSLGYSLKSTQENTIGQYGNGFKTSTMRLGSDVIVFSRCRGKDGGSPTQSVGMLSRTFLTRTNQEEIVVPMIDYKKEGGRWNMIVRSSPDDWRHNLDTLLIWSPYNSEEELFKEFDLMKDQGTRVVIFNLWQDDSGELELDFDTDRYDIQIKGANRDETKIEMARNYPNSRHFLTYSHSLRSYAAILYLRVPPCFRIILRGRDVDHHNIVNDMMYKQDHIYRPARVTDLVKGQSQPFANVTIGFVKDAESHIDVQGFCLYHKNRLINPFLRVWNAAGSGGRGIIGVIEADFVKPAHDKQGFEHTDVFDKLKKRICVIQKKYWADKRDKVGYATRKSSAGESGLPLNKSASGSGEFDNSAQPIAKNVKRAFQEYAGDDRQNAPEPLPKRRDYKQPPVSQAASTKINHMQRALQELDSGDNRQKAPEPLPKRMDYKQPPVSQAASTEINHMQKALQELDAGNERQNAPEPLPKRRDFKQPPVSQAASTQIHQTQDHSNAVEEIEKLKKENLELREKLKEIEGVKVADLMRELQYMTDRNNALEINLKQTQEKIQEFDKEQETLIDLFSEERRRRDQEDENLRMQLKEASRTIEDLANKLKQHEKFTI